MFNHIHGHSHYSLLQAIGNLKAIAKQIKSLGQEVMPISDYNGMYGAIQQFAIAEKEWLKPLIGVDLCTHTVKEGKTERSYYMTLLAKNYEGYRTLLEIVSEAHTEGSDTSACFPIEKLNNRTDNIIGIMGGHRSYLSWLVDQWESEKKLTELMKIYAWYFPQDQFFFEITAQSYEKIPTLKKVNETIISLSESTNIPCLVDNDFHHVSADEKDAFDIAGCIKDGKQYYEHGRKKIDGDWHIMSEREIVNVLAGNGYSPEQIQTWTDNNQQLIDMIDVKIPLHQLLFPVYESPQEIKDLYAHFEQKIA